MTKCIESLGKLLKGNEAKCHYLALHDNEKSHCVSNFILAFLNVNFKKKLQQALHYIMLRLRHSVVVEDGVNESRGSVVSHPETNFNHQFVGDPFPHHVFVNKP